MIEDDRSDFAHFMTWLPQPRGYTFGKSVQMFNLRDATLGLPHNTAVMIWKTPSSPVSYSHYGATFLGDEVGIGLAPLQDGRRIPEDKPTPRIMIACITAPGIYEYIASTKMERNLLGWLQRYYFDFHDVPRDRADYWRATL